MSRYIKEIHRVEERPQDLMADIISSMKSQIKFLTPAIAGIVIGITSMISTILTKLSAQLGAFSAAQESSGGEYRLRRLIDHIRDRHTYFPFPDNRGHLCGTDRICFDYPKQRHRERRR